MFTKKNVVAFLVASLFSVNCYAQFTATWAFTSNVTGGKAGVQLSDITIADAVVGSGFTSNVSYGSNGVKCQPSSGTNWPTVATDGFNIDFPFAPNGAVDATLLGLTFAARTSGGNSADNNMASLAYQVDGVGAFISFGSPQSIIGGGGSTINFTGLNRKLFSGHTYIIRMYIYAGVAGITASRSVSIKTAIYNGTSTPVSIQPSVTTTSATSTGKYTATVIGSVIGGGIGTYNITESGVVWDFAANPTIALTTKNNSGPTTGGFINLANGGAISGLSANTTYHTRAYVMSETGNVFYGADVSFTTDVPTIPSLTTVAVTGANNPTSIKAISGGIIVDNGGVAITAKGVCWSTATNPTIALTTKTNDGIGNANFSSTLKILTPSTKYYTRAYAINAIGTGYGNLDSFTTLATQSVIIISTANGQNSIPFGNVVVKNTSSTQSYTVTANALQPLVGSITITAPAGFEISLSASSGYSSTLSIPYTTGSITPTTIYVHFAPNLFGDVTSTITHTGGGVNAVNIDNVTVTGKGIQSPSEFSNAGFDFWLGNGYQERNDRKSGDSHEGKLSIYIAAGNQDAVISVELPGIIGAAGFPKTNITIPANTIYEVKDFPTGSTTNNMNPTGLPDSRLFYTGFSKRGIHVYSTNGTPISVWMHTYADNNSAAGAMIFPTNTWNSQYTVQAYGGQKGAVKPNGGFTNNSNPNSYFFVIAKEDNTPIWFSPSQDIVDSSTTSIFKEGHTTANVKYQAGVNYGPFILNTGEIFNAMGYIEGTGSNANGLDLTGSKVWTNCDKKIGVFGGNGRCLVNAATCNATSGSDHMIQQMFPKVAWGTKYVTVPTKTMEYNLFRITVDDATTKVWFNDPQHMSPLTGLVNNLYYEIATSEAALIESDKPINLTQFITAGGCATANGAKGLGDPEMIILSPVQQAIESTTVFSAPIKNPSATYNGHYINVVIKKAGISSFKLDGFAVGDTGIDQSIATSSTCYDASGTISMMNAFVQHPYDNQYYYAKFKVAPNASHTLKSDLPFNAIAYGMGDGESYGYNAGTKITPNRYLSVNNHFPNTTGDEIIATCLNDSFHYVVLLPYKPLYMRWNFFNNPNQLPNSDSIYIGNPIPTDSTNINGTKLYKYSLPTTYKFTATGNHPVSIIINGNTENGCTIIDTIPLSIKVIDAPTAYFITSYSPCLPTFVNFTDSSYDANGYNMVDRLWTFPSIPPTTSKDSTPTISFNSTGTYSIQLRAINSIGCYKDTTQTITLYPNPIIDSVKTDNKGVDCAGRKITFIAYATPGTGTITKWYWEFGDGTKDTTVTNFTTHTYTAENLIGYLVKVFVETSNGCICPVYTILQPIYKLKAAFTFVTPQCVNSPVVFTDASTGEVTNATIDTKFDWNFGDPAFTTSTVQSPSFTYITAGTFIVKLKTALMRGGVEFCADSINQTITITPVVNITNITTSNTGDDCAGKSITYDAIGNTATGSIKWYWEFSDGKKDTTTNNQVSHTFINAGSYTVKVFAKVDGGCDGISFSLNQAIYKLKAAFTFVTPQCINSLVQFTDITTGEIFGGALDTKFNWSFGDAANTTSTLQNPQYTYTNAGTYNVKLITTLVRGIIPICIDSTKPPKQIVISPKLIMSAVNVDATATTTTSLTFKWAGVAGATAYQISTDNGATWTNPSTGSTGLTHVLTGLTTNTTYNLCVKALGTCPSDTSCSTGKTASTITEIFVPNAFTPNGQGASQNEKLIICINNASNIRCAIFNQWGEKMFETSNPNPTSVAGCFEIWDGKAKGVLQPTGVYIYVASVTVGGNVKTKKGMVNLIR